MISNHDLRSCLQEAKDSIDWSTGVPVLLSFAQDAGTWGIHQFITISDSDGFMDTPKRVAVCQILPEALEHSLKDDVFPVLEPAITNYARFNLVPAGTLSLFHFLPPSEANPVYPKPTVN